MLKLLQQIMMKKYKGKVERIITKEGKNFVVVRLEGEVSGLITYNKDLLVGVTEGMLVEIDATDAPEGQMPKIVKLEILGQQEVNKVFPIANTITMSYDSTDGNTVVTESFEERKQKGIKRAVALYAAVEACEYIFRGEKVTADEIKLIAETFYKWL